MGCVFCDYEEIKKDILYESDNFRIKIGFGLVAPGHVMLITKDHYRCYGELPSFLETEFTTLKNKIISFVTQQFSNPFLTEYGVWGQTVPHAHVHFLPSRSEEYQVQSFVREMRNPGFPPVLGNLTKLKQIYQQDSKYVMIQEGDQMYIYRDLPDDKTGTELDFRDFFANRGLPIRSWKHLSSQQKKEDEKKRNKTKQVFNTFWNELFYLV